MGNITMHPQQTITLTVFFPVICKYNSATLGLHVHKQ